MGADGVGEEAWEADVKRGGSEPKVKPEGSGVTVSNNDLGNGAKGVESGQNVLPNRSIKIVMIAKIPGRPPTVHPAEPACPRGDGIRVEFSKEFGEKRRVLGGDRENA
jgi:hypothetical protein